MLIRLLLFLSLGATLSCQKSVNQTSRQKAQSTFQDPLEFICLEETSRDELQTKVSDLDSKIKQAYLRGNFAKAAKIELRKNYLTELLELPDEHDHDAEEEIFAKFQSLAESLDDKILAYQDMPPEKIPQRPVDAELQGLYDQPRIMVHDYRIAYSKGEYATVKRVKKDFGRFYINETKGYVEHSAIPAWSGYWYPFKDKSLYEGENSVLQKFDRVLGKMGHTTNLAQAEASRLNTTEVETWAGLCYGLAIASILTPEPIRPLVLQGETFSISEQKSLRAYSRARTKIKARYGVINQDSGATANTWQDIRPEAFMSVVTNTFDKYNTAVFVDVNPGVAKFNKALFNVRYRAEPEKNIRNAYKVTIFASYTEYRKNKKDDNRVTTDEDRPDTVYKARLYVSKHCKNCVVNGKYKVIAGEWIEDSYEQHPDTVAIPSHDKPPVAHVKEFNDIMPLYLKLFEGKS